MTREETKQLVRITLASYPNWKITNPSDTVEVWHLMLADYDYNQISLALKAYIQSDISGFAPSVGQIIGKLQDIHKPKISEMEAWELVRKAVCNSNYCSKEEYDKLPEDIQRAVGGPGNLKLWALTDLNEFNTVIQSNFMRSFKAVSESARNDERVSSNVLDQIKLVTERLEKF